MHAMGTETKFLNIKFLNIRVSQSLPERRNKVFQIAATKIAANGSSRSPQQGYEYSPSWIFERTAFQCRTFWAWREEIRTRNGWLAASPRDRKPHPEMR